MSKLRTATATLERVRWSELPGGNAQMATLGRITMIVKAIGPADGPYWQPWAIGPRDGWSVADRPMELLAARSRAEMMAREMDAPGDHGIRPENLNSSNDG